MAFGIPIVEALQAKKQKNQICKSPKCLILEPTRELAKQVGDDFNKICETLRCCCVYGGVSYERQSRLFNSLSKNSKFPFFSFKNYLSI